MTEAEYVLKYRDVFLKSISEPIHYDTDLPILIQAVSDVMANVSYLIDRFPELRDVDLVSDEFLKYLFKEYLVDFPYLEGFNYREFIKDSKWYYSSKGTENALAYIAALGGVIFSVWEPAKYIIGPSSRGLFPSGGYASRSIDSGGKNLGRIRDGVFWSKYTYVINVGNLKYIDSIDALMPLIDLNHPAGTKYFLNYFYHSNYEKVTRANGRELQDTVYDYYNYKPTYDVVVELREGDPFIVNQSHPTGLDLLSGKITTPVIHIVDTRDRDWTYGEGEVTLSLTWTPLHTYLNDEEDVGEYLSRAYQRHPPVKQARQHDYATMQLGSRSAVLSEFSSLSSSATGVIGNVIDLSAHDPVTWDEYYTEAQSGIRHTYTTLRNGAPVTVVVNPTKPLPSLNHTVAKDIVESWLLHRPLDNDRTNAALMSNTLFYGAHQYAAPRTLGEKYRVTSEWLQEPLATNLLKPYHSKIDTNGGSTYVRSNRYWDNLVAPDNGVVRPQRKKYQPSVNVFEIVS